MRNRCIILCLILCMPILSMTQDSIKKEAFRQAHRQADSVKRATKYYWYQNPNVVVNGMTNELARLNQLLIESQTENNLHFKQAEYLAKEHNKANQQKLDALYRLGEANKEKERLQNNINFINNSLLMLFLLLTVAWIVLKIIGMTRAVIKGLAHGAKNCR